MEGEMKLNGLGQKDITFHPAIKEMKHFFMEGAIHQSISFPFH